MNTLVIASLRASAGKTSLIVGLSRLSGKNIGYMKPFGDRLLYSKKRLWDYDAALMAEIFSMGEEPETMSIGFDHSKLRYMYNENSIREKVLELATEMSAGKDLLMVECGKSITYGHSVHLDPLSLARYLNGHLLFVNVVRHPLVARIVEAYEAAEAPGEGGEPSRGRRGRAG